MSYQYHSRRNLKDRETFSQFKPQLTAKASDKAEESICCSNQLVAGYMAYEYLTEGTLFGQKLDPAVPLPAARVKTEEVNGYDEVASILKTQGAHIPGIVNPTQLARWIQM